MSRDDFDDPSVKINFRKAQNHSSASPSLHIGDEYVLIFKWDNELGLRLGILGHHEGKPFFFNDPFT